MLAGWRYRLLEILAMSIKVACGIRSPKVLKLSCLEKASTEKIGQFLEERAENSKAPEKAGADGRTL
jgi:hypothetical protein